MASIPELLNGHVTLEVECLDRWYLNGYMGSLATAGGLVTEKFREDVKALAGREQIPIYAFNHKERKDDDANRIRQERGVRDGVVFIGVAQEKAHTFQRKKIDGQFLFTRDKAVFVNHYYLYIHDADFGPLFLKVCSYAPWAIPFPCRPQPRFSRQRRFSADHLSPDGSVTSSHCCFGQE